MSAITHGTLSNVVNMNMVNFYARFRKAVSCIVASPRLGLQYPTPTTTQLTTSSQPGHIFCTPVRHDIQSNRGGRHTMIHEGGKYPYRRKGKKEQVTTIDDRSVARFPTGRRGCGYREKDSRLYSYLPDLV